VGVQIREQRYKDNAKTVQNVTGYDANSLYLYCLSLKMPTGFPIRRKPEDNFYPVKTFSISQVAMEWLEYETLKRGTYIKHRPFSYGHEIGCRKVRLDGFAPETQSVFQFYGRLKTRSVSYRECNHSLFPFTFQNL